MWYCVCVVRGVGRDFMRADCDYFFVGCAWPITAVISRLGETLTNHTMWPLSVPALRKVFMALSNLVFQIYTRPADLGIVGWNWKTARWGLSERGNIIDRCRQKSQSANTLMNENRSTIEEGWRTIKIVEKNDTKRYPIPVRSGTKDAKIIWNIIWKPPKAFCFLIKMQIGYKRCNNYVEYNLKQTEKRNEKRGSISYAARTAKYSPTQQQPSVPGVSYVPLGRVIP